MLIRFSQEKGLIIGVMHRNCRINAEDPRTFIPVLVGDIIIARAGAGIRMDYILQWLFRFHLSMTHDGKLIAYGNTRDRRFAHRTALKEIGN